MVAPEHLDGLGRVEAGEQRQGASALDRGVEPAGEAEDVEEGQAAHDDVVLGDLHDVGRGALGVAVEVEVRQLGALGLAGGAARVEDDRRVVVGALDRLEDGGRRRLGGVELAVGRAHRAAHDEPRAGLGSRLAGLVGEVGPHEAEAGAAVLVEVLDLPGLQQRVHRDDHAAGEQRAVEGDGVCRHVGEDERHPVAGLETRRAQLAGHRCRRTVQRRPRQLDLVELDAHLVGDAGRGGDEVGGEVGHLCSFAGGGRGLAPIVTAGSPGEQTGGSTPCDECHRPGTVGTGWQDERVSESTGPTTVTDDVPTEFHQEWADLAEQAATAQFAYHVKDAPTISDGEYDQPSSGASTRSRSSTRRCARPRARRRTSGAPRSRPASRPSTTSSAC